MKKYFLAALLLAFGGADLAQGQEEPDYGPGFFETENDTTFEDMMGGETNGDLPAEGAH